MSPGNSDPWQTSYRVVLAVVGLFWGVVLLLYEELVQRTNRKL